MHSGDLYFFKCDTENRFMKKVVIYKCVINAFFYAVIHFSSVSCLQRLISMQIHTSQVLHQE